MNAEQLKNSILQRAIEGKLVEQRAEEGTAVDLLREIKAEKARLVKEGKIKKEKPLPEIAVEEIPFEIPDSWVWVRWGDLSQSIQYGYSAPAKTSGRIKMVRISDIHNNKILWDTVPYCDIAESDIETYRLEKDDILFARTGGTVGKSYLVREMPEEAVYAGYLIRTRCSNSLIPQYLKFFMESSLYWLQLRSGTIATAQPNCNGKTLSKMMLPLPPLAEQKRIVAKIEELLPYIERYGKAHDELTALNEKFPDAMKKSVLQYAIEGKLVEQRPEEGTAKELLAAIKAEKRRLVKEGKLKKEKPLPEIKAEEIPFAIPDSWEWVRLGEIAFTNIGLTYKPTNIVENGGTVILRSSNIQNGRIDYSETVRVNMNIPENKMCSKGDILICVRNGSKRLVGKAAPIENDGMSFGAFMAILSPLITNNRYILRIINSAYFRNTLLNETGTTTINQITQNMLKEVLIPLPPLAEQKRIVTKIEKLLACCERLGNETTA